MKRDPNSGIHDFYIIDRDVVTSGCSNGRRVVVIFVSCQSADADLFDQDVMRVCAVEFSLVEKRAHFFLFFIRHMQRSNGSPVQSNAESRLV